MHMMLRRERIQSVPQSGFAPRSPCSSGPPHKRLRDRFRLPNTWGEIFRLLERCFQSVLKDRFWGVFAGYLVLVIELSVNGWSNL